MRVLAAGALLLVASTGAYTLSRQVLTTNPFRKSAPIPAQIMKIDEKSFVFAKAAWKKMPIPVCWESLPGDGQSRSDRALVESSAKGAWEKKNSGAAIEFLFSKSACVADEEGLHIRVADTDAETLGLGTQLDRLGGGMLLNFQNVVVKPDCPVESQRTRCIRVMTVHEFGHALGFAHESNRDDRSVTCHSPRTGPDGDTQLNNYDPASVMNYCNQANFGNLSDGDRKGAAFLYPVR